MTDEKTQDKIPYCKNCKFSCQATECECVCHTQSDGFNYGLRLGREETLAHVKTEIEKMAVKNIKVRFLSEWSDGYANAITDVRAFLEEVGKMEYAKDYKCKKCGKKQATAFFGLADPDAEQTPMCEDCILETKMDFFHKIDIIKRKSKK